jgi:hypothetical protein
MKQLKKWDDAMRSIAAPFAAESPRRTPYTLRRIRMVIANGRRILATNSSITAGQVNKLTGRSKLESLAHLNTSGFSHAVN